MQHLLNMYKHLLLLISLSLPLVLHARKGFIRPPEPEAPSPWFTGPLLTPSGHVVGLGHMNFEPYVSWTDFKGLYDEHWHSHEVPHFKTLLIQPTFQVGILPRTEFDFVPQALYNNSQGAHDWRVGDLPFTFGIQLLNEDPQTWHPAIKLRLSAVAPIGKYDRFDPKKFGTDFGGLGNWAPSLGLVFSRLFYFGEYYFLTTRFWLNYQFSTPVHVHGLNIYGGAPDNDGIKGTRGTVYPGNIFIVTQGFEFSVSRNWVFALDIQYQHSDRNRFSGHSPKGTKPVAPSAELFSLAPAIEYNFNGDIGVIFGPWFSVAGRNSNLTFDFISWVFAFNYYR